MVNPHSSVNVVRVDGTDNDIALAASICYGKKYIDNTKSQGLIKALLIQGHKTPFEWGRIWFDIRCTRACHSQLLQYRLASRLTRSLRRTLPIEIEENLNVEPWMQSTLEWYQEACKTNLRENARRYLPLDVLTDTYWYVNLSTLMHFLDERLEEDAQDEIRYLAGEMEKAFAIYFPLTYTNWRNIKDDEV